MGAAWRRAHWRPHRRCGSCGSRARSAGTILVRSCRLPGGRRDARDLPALDLPREPDHDELDHPARQLGTTLAAIGIRACRECASGLDGALFCDVLCSVLSRITERLPDQAAKKGVGWRVNIRAILRLTSCT